MSAMLQHAGSGGHRTQVSAHTGLDWAGESLQLSIEFWIIALHITVVVNRAYRSLVLVRLMPPHPRRVWYLPSCQSFSKSCCIWEAYFSWT